MEPVSNPLSCLKKITFHKEKHRYGFTHFRSPVENQPTYLLLNIHNTCFYNNKLALPLFLSCSNGDKVHANLVQTMCKPYAHILKHTEAVCGIQPYVTVLYLAVQQCCLVCILVVICAPYIGSLATVQDTLSV